MVKDFLLFRRMLTPFLVQLFFWIVVGVCVITAVNYFLHRFWLNGLQVLVVGPILARLVAEWLILFFRMNETLTEIKDRSGVS